MAPNSASGGAGGTRTLDLCVANAPLSHLSYNPKCLYYIISQFCCKDFFEIFLFYDIMIIKCDRYPFMQTKKEADSTSSEGFCFLVKVFLLFSEWNL